MTEIKISVIEPIAQIPGNKITIRGESFLPNVELKVDEAITKITILDSTSASFIMPQGKPGSVSIKLVTNGAQLAAAEIYRMASDYPLFTGDPNQVCSDQQFYNASGDLQSGTQTCLKTPLASDALKKENIKKGINIGGITGELVTHQACTTNLSQNCIPSGTYYAAKMCSSDGEVKCTIDDGTNFKAAASNTLSAGNIKRGIQIGGVTGTYPSAASPLLRYIDDGATATESGSDESDLVSFISQLTSGGTFEFWDSSGKRYTGSGDSDIINYNIRAGKQFENLNITGSAQIQPPSTPTGLSSSYQSSPELLALTWNDVSVAGYLLIVKEGGSAITFTPTNGQSYSPGTQGSDEVIYVGTATSYNHTGISNSSTYNYKIYSYDEAHVYSSSADSASFEALPTPIAYWAMNEGSGTSLADTSPGGDNDGTFSASEGTHVSWITGKFGNGININGVGTTPISAPDTGMPSGHANSYSISCWFQVSYTSFATCDTYPVFLRWGTSATAKVAGLGLSNYGAGATCASNKNLRLQLHRWGGTYDEAAFLSQTGLANAWHHAVATYNGSTKLVALYYDGQNLKSDVEDTPNTTLNGSIVFGSSNGGTGRYTGYLDDCAVFDQVLSQSHVDFIWNGGTGRPIIP